MNANPLHESNALLIAGLLVLAVFITLGIVEYRIEYVTDPDRFRLSFFKPEGSSLAAELCSDGPDRDFSVSALIESTDEPYFETTIAVDSHDCVVIPVPTPEILPDGRPAHVRIRATDSDGRALEIFRML